MLWYVPLEMYKERYTMQLSAPVVGWLEKTWIELGIEYRRVDGLDTGVANIKTGVVLDAVRRSKFALSQVLSLLELVESGEIKNDDVIFFDDFWHPGIEALPYIFHALNIHPKMYGFCYAQSVDEFDFTYPMRQWMRPFEKGIGSILSGVFVANTLLKDLLVDAEICTPEKIHVVGLIFDSNEVSSRMIPTERKNQVVYSSRWDKEKNPLLFLKIVDRMMQRDNSVSFVVCSGSEQLRSNSLELVHAAYQYCVKYPDNFFVKTGLTKEQYYSVLCESKIQVNTAYQDWVSFTLLEASVAGCYPVYPYFRSFPETFQHRHEFMYGRNNLIAAANLILRVLGDDDNWSVPVIESRRWIHTRYDYTNARMLKVMGLFSDEVPVLYEGA